MRKAGSVAKSTASVLWKILVGVLVAVLILVLVVEFGLRWFIGNQLREEFNAQAAESGVVVEEDPTISFGATPLILSAVTGTVNEVTVTTPSTLQISYPTGDATRPEVSGQPAAVIDMRDLAISDLNNPVAGQLTTTTELPEDFLLAVIQEEAAAAQGGNDGFLQDLLAITALTANPAESVLDVEFSRGLASLTLRPVTEGGQLSFEATSAALFGFGLPAEVADAISAALRSGVDEQVGNMRVEEFTVIEQGVRVRITGENVPLGELSETGQLQLG